LFRTRHYFERTYGKNKKNKSGYFFRDFAKTLVAVIDEKGTPLSGHSERVAGCCVNFARMISLRKKRNRQDISGRPFS